MKDRQVEQLLAAPRIPVISTLLHCVAMTVIVFLRSGFGYAYFRPKALFFAFSWAFALYSVYSWIEPGKWRTNGALCIYGVATIGLYWLHLSWTFATEVFGIATHDNHSGTPHTLRILGWLGKELPQKGLNIWVIWIEPAVVLAAALFLRFGMKNKNLSTWLLLAALSLWLKEALNYWLQLRQRKRHQDTLEDAREGLNESPAVSTQAKPLAPSRQEKVRRQRLQ